MNQKLIEVTGRSNNLQMMKSIAALLVICSHSVPIVTGSMEAEPLYRLTGGQLSMGGLAVGVFFLSAGYFIAASAAHRRTVKAFFRARCIRIFPLLWIVVLMSIFLGAAVTTLPAMDYWCNHKTWLYLLNGFLIPVHNLPGVFEHVPYLPTVNGALWTLPVEFACYIVCFLCHKLHLLRRGYYFLCFIPATSVALILLFMEGRYPFLMQIFRPCFLFLIGMGYWVYRERIKLHFYLIIPVTVLFLGCFVFGAANIGMFLFFPYLCMLLWFYPGQVSLRISAMGDMSYGIYLCGFPVQQLLVQISGDTVGLGMQLILACLISGFLGYCLMKIENRLKTI